MGGFFELFIIPASLPSPNLFHCFLEFGRLSCRCMDRLTNIQTFYIIFFHFSIGLESITRQLVGEHCGRAKRLVENYLIHFPSKRCVLIGHAHHVSHFARTICSPSLKGAHSSKELLPYTLMSQIPYRFVNLAVLMLGIFFTKVQRYEGPRNPGGGEISPMGKKRL